MKVGIPIQLTVILPLEIEGDPADYEEIDCIDGIKVADIEKYPEILDQLESMLSGTETLWTIVDEIVKAGLSIKHSYQCDCYYSPCAGLVKEFKI